MAKPQQLGIGRNLVRPKRDRRRWPIARIPHLDRLGRSIHDLIEAVLEFERRGIGFRSLKEGMIDTTNATGKLIFHVFGAIAEYERGTNHERTMAGIAAAKRAGTKFGRPSTITDSQWSEAVSLFADKPPRSVVAVARLLGVSRQSIYRRLAEDPVRPRRLLRTRGQKPA